MIRVKNPIVSAVILLFVISTAWSQQLKIFFAQVAVGGSTALEMESVITLTNSGSEEFDGTLHFWKGAGEQWNPNVDGLDLTMGNTEVKVGALSTKTFRLTGTGTDLEVGYAIVTGRVAAASFLEGNLTYFVRSEGKITDSVGVAPSVGLYRTTIPFADFSSVGLALANPHSSDKTVRLKLRNSTGSVIDTVNITLTPNSHSSRFLSEIFTNSADEGRVDLESEFVIYGTAVTFVAGQISTLPLQPSSVEYDLKAIASYDGTVTQGKLTLAAQGIFVRGLMELTSEDGVALDSPVRTPVEGRLIDGELRLAFYAGGDEFFDEDIILYVEAPGFSFDLQTFSVEFIELELAEADIGSGTLEFTRVIP